MPNPTIIELQRHLREKFPAARHGLPHLDPPEPSRFDFRNPASFPRGAITEITPSHPSSGFSLLVAALLEHDANPAPLPELALIDGRSTFDPASFTPAACSKLLWARCPTLDQSLKAADLLLRDGNLPLILLDLDAFPHSALRSIPGSSWYRLKQLCETSDSVLLALTPLPLIPCAQLRLVLRTNFQLDHLDHSRAELIDALEAAPTLQRKNAK